MHSFHIFFSLLLTFIVGIFVGSFITININILMGVMIVGIAFVALGWRGLNVSFRKKVAFVGIGLALIIFAFSVVRVNSSILEKNILKGILTSEQYLQFEKKVEQKFLISGYVATAPEVVNSRQRLVIEARQWIIGGRVVDLDERILVSTDLYPTYYLGQVLTVEGPMQLPYNVDGSRFDYTSYLAKDGIYTIMNFPSIESTQSNATFQLSTLETLRIGIFDKIFFVKEAFESAINKTVSEPNAGFLNGILVGSRSQLPQDLKDDFAATGTTHILAISGYNITIIAVIMSWIFMLFVKRKTAFWFAVVGIVIFTILVGAQASVVRASVMGILVLYARREGRISNPINMLSLAAAIMLALNPMILRYDVGFQLSFLATLGLIYVSPIIEKYFQKIPEAYAMRETIIMTVSAQLFVLPLIMYHFGTVSLSSLPVNVIILPLIPFTMLMGFATGIIGMFSVSIGTIIGYMAWLLSSIELWVIKLFALFSWATIDIEVNWQLLVILYIVIFFALAKLKKVQKTGMSA